MRNRVVLVFLLLATGCGGKSGGIASVGHTPARQKTWREIVHVEDNKRLSGLWRAWTTSRKQFLDAGKIGEWDASGALTDPVAATSGPWPLPGRYRCQLSRLGDKAPDKVDIVTGGAVSCRFAMSGTTLTLTTDGGVQRSTGRLYPDGDRMVFLGAVTLRGEIRDFAYAMDPDRNLVGVLERIGPTRWRLALPWSHWGSSLDVIDIIPEH